jgi:hypothetical protein
MADQFRDQINAARRAGYKDDELVGYLKDKDPRVSEALGQGYAAKEILDYLAPALSTGEEFLRKTGVAVRGATEALAPVAAGAGAGFLMGGPVGAGVGALAGGLAGPTSDVLVQGYNRLMGTNQPTPSQAISSMIPGPRAETPVERVIQGSAGALGGSAGSVGAGRAIVSAGEMGQAVAPGTLAVGREAARLPIAQLITAPVATAAGQTVTETTGSPLLGLAAGVATGSAAGLRPVKRGTVPTAEELAAKSKANYDILDKSNFQLDNNQFETHMAAVPAKLRASAGYDPRTMPKVDVALSYLTAGNPKTVQELDTLRTFIGNAAKSGDASERLAGKQLMDEFDTYVLNAKPSAIVAGDPQAMQAWKNARADYAKMKKSEVITDILENADVSQGSKEANIASQLSALAKNDKKMRFFTADEQQAIREAAKGGALQTMLRTIGKFTPMTPAAAIFTAVNPLGAYTAGAGMAAKSLAEQRRVQQTNALASRMRLGQTPEVIEGATANVPTFAARSAVNNLQGPSGLDQWYQANQLAIQQQQAAGR